MSDNTPTFNDALEAIGTLLNIDGTKLFGEIFEDVELARVTLREKSKGESAEKADDYSAVDEALDQLGVDKPEGDVDDEKPALSKWDVAIRDRDWASWAVVEAERVEIGPDLDGYDAGFNAYIGEDLVFHAPAGTYHYVRKVG